MVIRLKWSTLDLRDITAYIKADNPSAAASFALTLIERTELLREFPEMGRVIPEHNDPALREIIQGNYRIIYRFSSRQSKVQIVRLWHGARGMPKLS